MPTPAATRIRIDRLQLKGKRLVLFHCVVEFIFHICEGDRISDSFFWCLVEKVRAGYRLPESSRLLRAFFRFKKYEINFLY